MCEKRRDDSDTSVLDTFLVCARMRSQLQMTHRKCTEESLQNHTWNAIRLKREEGNFRVVLFLFSFISSRDDECSSATENVEKQNQRLHYILDRPLASSEKVNGRRLHY